MVIDRVLSAIKEAITCVEEAKDINGLDRNGVELKLGEAVGSLRALLMYLEIEFHRPLTKEHYRPRNIVQ